MAKPAALGMVGALIYHVDVGCADEGGASFAIDALRSSAHPMTELGRNGSQRSCYGGQDGGRYGTQNGSSSRW